jgi:hypothetical protein
MTDPVFFVEQCQERLNDGAARTAGGGPAIDESQPVDPLDMVWATTREAVEEIGPVAFDLSQPCRAEPSPV